MAQDQSNNTEESNVDRFMRNRQRRLNEIYRRPFTSEEVAEFHKKMDAANAEAAKIPAPWENL